MSSSEDNLPQWSAAQWVARRMSDEPFDEAGFSVWISADARHKPLFETMWSRIMGSDMDHALGDHRKRRRTRRALVGGGLASLLALAGVHAAWPSLALRFAQPQDYASAQNAIRYVRLADGTRLTLAGGAHVLVRFTGDDRVVSLVNGTIFVDVAQDGRRFRVETDTATIVDIGTRFEVSAKPSGVRVTVEHGSVRLGANGWSGGQVDIAAEQTAALTDAGVSEVRSVAPGGVARWRSGWVEYHDVTLESVMRDIESVSPLPIHIVGKRLAGLRVSGRIRLADPMRQIDNLAVLHDFTIDRSDHAILLMDRKPAG